MARMEESFGWAALPHTPAEGAERERLAVWFGTLSGISKCHNVDADTASVAEAVANNTHLESAAVIADRLGQERRNSEYEQSADVDVSLVHCKVAPDMLGSHTLSVGRAQIIISRRVDTRLRRSQAAS